MVFKVVNIATAVDQAGHARGRFGAKCAREEIATRSREQSTTERVDTLVARPGSRRCLAAQRLRTCSVCPRAARCQSGWRRKDICVHAVIVSETEREGARVTWLASRCVSARRADPNHTRWGGWAIAALGGAGRFPVGSREASEQARGGAGVCQVGGGLARTGGSFWHDRSNTRRGGGALARQWRSGLVRPPTDTFGARTTLALALDSASCTMMADGQHRRTGSQGD